ncbi:MAG: FHA domain-containing protein, partial [Hydrogeniiclostridium sp.]
MPEWQSFQDSLLYVLRILIPLLSIYVLVRAFHSIKAGRRREEPVIVLQNTVTKETVPVLYWENSIGRSRSCDVVLSDPTASRDHAVLMRRESGWFVTDTDSKAGTRVNGRLIHQSAVSPGDVITLGSTSLMLKRTSEAKLPQQQRRVRHAASPFGLLVTVSVIQFFLLLQACFGGGEFSFLPVMPFLAIQVMEWGLYLYSMKGLDHVSFELETIAFLLAGTGIMLLSGMRGELGEGQ